MKNITCCIGALILLNIPLYKSQQSISNKKVNYEAGKVTAYEAVTDFLKINKLQHSFSDEPLKKYKITGVKCTNETVTVCLRKILKGLPFDTIIYENIVIIRGNSDSKNTSSINTINPNDEHITIQKDTIDRPVKEQKIDEVILNAGYYNVKDKERTGSIAKVTASLSIVCLL